MAQDRARAKVLGLTLNAEQMAAVAAITRGWDYNYVIDGGPGTGKTLTTAYTMCKKEQRKEVCYYVIGQKKLAENMRTTYGLNAKSICAFTKQTSSCQSELPPKAFVQAHPTPKAHPQTLFVDEWGFASKAELSRLLACLRLLSTGPTQVVLIGDLSQLEAPCAEATPSIHHPIMRTRMRVLSLRDDTGRFTDPNFAALIENLREMETPISKKTETELQAQSYMSRFIPNTIRKATILCVTHAQRRKYNLAQWKLGHKTNRIQVSAAPNPRSMPTASRPPPIYMVYGLPVRVIANYWPTPPDTGEVIANGTTGILVRGPIGKTAAHPNTKFVVEIDGIDRDIFCRELSGDEKGWIHAPIDALGAATIAGVQGQTLDSITVDATGCDRRTLMVALSRGRQFFNGATGIHLINYEPESAKKYRAEKNDVDVYAEKFRRMANPEVPQV